MRLTLPRFTFSILHTRRAVLRAALACTLAALVLPLSVPAYAAGTQDGDSFWTTFNPSSDTRFVFVSTSGSDTNSGLSPSTPVKTLARAESLLRDGYPDWMLLKRGDVWYEPLPFWTKSGRAEDEKMVVGAYGDGGERPQIRPEGNTGAMKNHGDDLTQHVAFVGLHMEPRSRADDENATGISWRRRANDILFEDLYISGFAANITIEVPNGSAVEHIRINGCVVVDAWSLTAHAQGLYTSGIDGLTIENSVFASNGFNVARGAVPTIFNHNIYIQNMSENIVIRKNIIADASSHGLQLRSGGIVEDNLFISNPLSVLFGGGNYPSADGVTGYVMRNLIMYGRGIDSETPRSVGLETSNVHGAEISNNFFYKGEIGYNGGAINISGPSLYGLSGLIVENNTIIGWNGTVSVGRPPSGQVFHNVEFINNTIVRDMEANAGNANYNKPLISAFNANNPELKISGNHYRLLGIHNRPFLDANTPMNIDSWENAIEPDLSYTAISEMPKHLGLDSYMMSIGLDGGMIEFIEHARGLSRSHTDRDFFPTTVYQWFAQSLANQ